MVTFLVPALTAIAFALQSSPAAAGGALVVAVSGALSAPVEITVQVVVPKIVLLRVGPSSNINSVIDSLAWTATLAIPGGVTPAAANNGSGRPSGWNGNAPVSFTVSPAPVQVWAYTNASSATLRCSLGTWAGPAAGPTSANFTVTATSGTTLSHPGADLSGCANPVNIPSNNVRSGSWQYALTGNPASWPAGSYSNTITYTASAL